MKGKNKLCLSQEAIRGAVQWWLNEKVLVEPVYVQDVQPRNDEYHIAIEAVKEAEKEHD